MRSFCAVGAVCLLGAIGCSTPVIDPPSEADAGAGATQAIVVVERVERGSTASTNVSAKFARVFGGASADPEAFEHAVGSTLDLPPSGECRVYHDLDDEAPEAEIQAAGPIDLIDVGDVALESSAIAAGPRAMHLSARAFPDVGDRVSGVMYTSPNSSDDLPVPARYVLRVSGTDPGAAVEVDAFAIEAEAPAAPEEVRVNGAALWAAPHASAPNAPLTIAWGAPASAQADDLVYVELSVDAGVALRCAFEDRGAGVLPAALVSEVAAEAGALRSGVLAVHRVRQGSFRGPGLDAGEIRFDVSVSSVWAFGDP